MTEENVPPPPPPPADTTTPAPRGPMPYATPGASGYPGPYVGPAPDKDSKTMALLAHLLGILIGFIGPLVIWLLKKDTSPFVDDQGKESLNFQLTLLIGYIIAGATSCIFIGMLIFPVVWIVWLILGIMGAMKANEGVAYRSPVNIRFIK